MPLPDVRRIVTAHAGALAVIQSDEAIISQPYPSPSTSRFGTIWTFDSVPTNDNNMEVDGAKREIRGPGLGFVHEGGVSCRYHDLEPGGRVPLHRTTSVDLNILIQGEIVLVMEDGTETHLRNPGDTVVQRGTAHAWYNPSNLHTRVVSVIIDANPVSVEGQELQNEYLKS